VAVVEPAINWQSKNRNPREIEMSKKAMELALEFAENIYSRRFNLSGIAVEDAADSDRLLTEVSNLIAVLKEAIKQQGEQQGEPNGYARYMVGMTPEGWSITICNPLYASAPSTNGECD
jgi:hypothetical protein